MIKISEEEIKKRFQKLRNLEVLHENQKKRNKKLEKKNKKLEEENKEVKKLQKKVEKLELELEELKAMKFGKKRRIQKDTADSLPSEKEEREKDKKERLPESYRRREPKEEEVTEKLRMEIQKCKECGNDLCNKIEHIHYRDDLRKSEERVQQIKRIIEVTVEGGICQNKECSLKGKKQKAIEIPKQKVILGENLRQMVVYLLIMQGESYREIQKSFKELYEIKISSGQIANILKEESDLLSPYYNFLVEELEKEGKETGAHYDETTWKTQSQGKELKTGDYCWVKIGVESNNQLIWFGKSRGGKVAERLRGGLKEEGKRNSKGVSDNYGAYKNLFEHHQLCWAHPHRKLRDLAESTKLQGITKKTCQKAYKEFQEVYKKSRKLREELLESSSEDTLTKTQKEKRIKQGKKLFQKLYKERKNDPDKLKKIRESLKANEEKYFTFLEYPNLPLDNNKAERAIRKVVIRRKKTMGSKSPKGADTLSILYSVIFSLKENSPEKSFFELYDYAANFS
jgi:transposase